MVWRSIRLKLPTGAWSLHSTPSALRVSLMRMVPCLAGKARQPCFCSRHRFSSTEISLMTDVLYRTQNIPAVWAWRMEAKAAGLLSTYILPPLMEVLPLMISASTDLPLPLSPATQSSSPLYRERLISSRAFISPYAFFISSSRIFSILMTHRPSNQRQWEE